MDIVYRTKDNDDLQLTMADCQVPLFGRWCDFSFTSYATHGGVALNIIVQPLKGELRNGSSTFDARMSYRPLSLIRPTANGQQMFHQQLEFARFFTVILHWSELANGGVEAGRTISRAVLRKMASVIETIRCDIRSCIGSDVRQMVIRELQTHYHKTTANAIVQLLKDINWGMLFRLGDCNDDTMITLVNSLDGRNPVEWNSIIFDGESRIDPIYRNTEDFSFSSEKIADYKATALLRNVCGPVLGDEFEKTGSITFEKNGYTFRAKPGNWLDCYDPQNKHARLCIHTIGFAVNPVDEVTFAYLNIRHKFDEYMSVAVYHNEQTGFVRPTI